MKLKLYMLVILVLVLAVLAGTGFYVWYLLQPTDEELIREAVTGIETALSAPYRSDLPGQTEDMAALKQYLGEEIRIALPCYRYRGTFTRQKVLGDYFAIRNHLKTIKVVCSDVVVSFPADQEGIAIVHLTVQASWRNFAQSPYLVKLVMSKESGDWLVTGITFLETKKIPGSNAREKDLLF